MELIYNPAETASARFNTAASGTTGGSPLILLYEFDEVDGTFLQLGLLGEVGGERTETRVCNASSAAVAVCEKKADGTYDITYGMPLAVIMDEDVIVAVRGGYQAVLTQIFVFRDNSQ